jgi:hypothetical protein
LISGNLVFCDDEGHDSSCFGLVWIRSPSAATRRR